LRSFSGSGGVLGIGEQSGQSVDKFGVSGLLEAGAHGGRICLDLPDGHTVGLGRAVDPCDRIDRVERFPDPRDVGGVEHRDRCGKQSPAFHVRQV
jgi:hypothetical protein